MDIRKNIYSLSSAELTSFRDAVNAIKANGTYDTFIHRHHEAMMNATPMSGEPSDPNWRNTAHRGPAFLPWHRQELRDFELALQAVAPGVTLPYWDWAQDAALADPRAAPLWTDAYIGGDGAGPNDIVPNGPFTHWIALIASSGGTLVPRATRGIVRRLGRDPRGFPTLPTLAQVTNALDEGVYDSAPWRTTSDPSFRNRLEGWPIITRDPNEPRMHNRVHTWVGGDMLPGTSPNDPVFFLHHCNVDRLWAIWQHANPYLSYVPTGGGPPGHNRSDPMQFLSSGLVTPGDTLNHRVLGYTYDRFVDFDLSPHQFTPTAGVWDSEVTLFGRNFDVGRVRVYFGLSDYLESALVSVTPTQIVVRVPAGTGSGPLMGLINIIVTNAAGSAMSDDLFTVIPT